MFRLKGIMPVFLIAGLAVIALLVRVSGVSISLMTVAQLTGVAISGKLAAWMGIRHAYLLLAALLGVIGAGGFAFATRFRLHGVEPAND